VWCGRRVKKPTTGEAISGGGSDNILLGSSPSPALKTLAERSITRRFLSPLSRNHCHSAESQELADANGLKEKSESCIAFKLLAPLLDTVSCTILTIAL
jgi:hypothetical protein